ncbi:hypothetical protein [Longibaculum muris]|uniref:hypothetical protein n=1 Tax=Longibaculum muris TaxID=1796628 RepID=UPI0022E40C81|nr:hypothetical protein [Longibaculum muris]
MSFQEKFKAYQERQEAKKYFRSNNDQFLDSSQWVKTIVGGLLAAIACGIILGVVITALHITSSLFYLICGYVVAMAVTKIANVHSNQVAIMSVVLTFVCFVVGEMTMMYLPIYEMGIGIGGLGIINLIVISVKSLFFGDLFTIIIAVLGLFIAYEVAK